MLGGYSSIWVLHLALWGYFVLEVLATTTNVCHTPGCVQAAERVKKNMDPSVNPCEDFYHFACGNYVKTEKIAKHNTQITSFITVDNILQKQLYSLLNSSSKHPNETKPFKMARNLYNICLREDLIEKRGVGFLLDMIKSVGGWPVLEGEEWDADKFDWMETVYKLHDLGLGGNFFSVGVNLEYTLKLIEIDQVSFGLNREYLIEGRDNLLVLAYESYMADIAHLFGAKHGIAVKDFGDVLDFEVEMAISALSKEDRRDISKLYNPMQIKDLKERYPIVRWDEYLKTLINNITRLRSDEVIQVNVPTYLDKVQILLMFTDKRTLANYLIWKSISDKVGFLTIAMRDRQLLYKKDLIHLTGIKEHEPRWKECLKITTDRLSLAVSAMYVRNFFKEEANENANEMVENIRLEMLILLKSVNWMDAETRSRAIDKALAMRKHIGYPNELLEDKKLEQFYENLEITGELFFESILNLTRFDWNYSVGKLREPINKTDWRSHGSAAIINAFYNHMENSIQIPAGILQNVFFSHDRPRYMNYGAIGSVIAREITHGFDNMGKQFNKVGNLKLWWKPQTRKAFRKRMKCVIDQANNYTVKSVKMSLNGINTQGENVADSGGVKLAHRAYNSWAAKNDMEPRLAGLVNYSPQQMFWLSAASVWCTVYSKKALRMQITTGYHSPAEYRVNNAMRNQEAFAKDFNCPVGSNMNPVEKCNVW